VSCSQAWKRKTLEEAARSCDDREKALKEWERRVRSERDEAKKMRDAAEKESTAAKVATEDSVKRKRDAEKKSKECDKIKEEFKIKETRFESECTQRLDKMTADELALARRSNDLEAAAMDVAAQVAAAAESRTESEAVLKACENEKERLEALDAHLEKENARVNAQRTVVERAFEDAQEERRIIAEAAEEADVVRRQLEESANDLDAKHAEADARQQVLDEVTVLHQQWEQEQGEREKHASDTLEVAEAAERKAEEQATRARVEREAMERARKAFEESELALDERERKLAHTWQTIRADAHRISTASYRASIGAQRSQGRIIEAKAEMSRLFGPGGESEDHVASVPTSPLAPPPTPGGDLAAATAARKALLASFDAGEPTVAAPARASYPSDHAVSEMLGKFIFIIVWAISMTACFVHRRRGVRHLLARGRREGGVRRARHVTRGPVIDPGAHRDASGRNRRRGSRGVGGGSRRGWYQGRPLLATRHDGPADGEEETRHREGDSVATVERVVGPRGCASEARGGDSGG